MEIPMSPDGPEPGLAAADAEVIERAKPVAGGFLLVLLVAFLCMLVSVLPSAAAHWRLMATGLLPVIDAGLLVLIILLCHKAAESRLGAAYWVGLLSIWLSAGFDAASTIYYCPTLKHEGNPVFRLFLDRGCGVDSVYVYAVGVLGVSCILFSLCWTAVYSHCGPWMRQSGARAAGSFPRFYKAATGGANVSWRQYFLPLRRTEMPEYYSLTLALAAVMPLSITLAHFHCGLVWVKLLPPIHPLVLFSVDLAVSLVLFVVWLAWQYRKVCRSAKP